MAGLGFVTCVLDKELLKGSLKCSYSSGSTIDMGHFKSRDVCYLFLKLINNSSKKITTVKEVWILVLIKHKC